MRPRRSEPDRSEVVAHRLSLLVPPAGPAPRDELSSSEEPEPPAWWGTHTRVRDRGPGPEPERWPDELTRPDSRLAAVAPDPVERAPAAGHPVPVPGRHASRRPRALPGLSAGPLLLAPTHLAVLAVVMALGLALTSWWVVRSDPVPVAAPTTAGPDPSASPLALLDAAPGPPGQAAGATDASVVVVDVAGKVRRPGVVELPAGSRVVDALEAAGGVRRGVDLSGLNLARVLVDGEQVLVGEPAAAVPPGAAGPTPGVPAPPGATAPAAALVDLNTADQATLEALPEIGPVTAQAILAWRTEHGGFTAVQELLEVDGIGPATLETLAPLVTV